MKTLASVTAAITAGLALVAPIHPAEAGKGGATAAATTGVRSTPAVRGDGTKAEPKLLPKSAGESVLGGGVSKIPCLTSLRPCRTDRP